MSDQSTEIIEEPSYTVTLSEREKAIRDKFVQEYLTDYDSTAAAIRIGYPQSISKEYGVRFMNEPYVLQQIRLKETTPEKEEDLEVMKKRIMAGLLREANYRGPGCSQSARVAALAKLASMHGMDAPSRSQTEIVNPGGLAGVFLIPGLMTPEQWELAAAAQQEALVNGTLKPADTPKADG
jgi:hypothetical protein